MRSLPYFCGFEDQCGYDWTQLHDDDFEWHLWAGDSPTGQTDPGAAAQGRVYALSEAIHGDQGDIAK